MTFRQLRDLGPGDRNGFTAVGLVAAVVCSVTVGAGARALGAPETVVVVIGFTVAIAVVVVLRRPGRCPSDPR